MILSTFERLLLRNIVPQTQGWDGTLAKEAGEFLAGLFTQEEKNDLAFEQEGQQIKWRLKRDDGTDIPQERNISISNELRIAIRQSLESLASLCKKFGTL